MENSLLTGKRPVPPKRDRRGPCLPVGRKGHNQNEISFPRSPALWAGSFTNYLLLDPADEDLHRSLNLKIPATFLDGFPVNFPKEKRLTPLNFPLPLNKKGRFISLRKSGDLT